MLTRPWLSVIILSFFATTIRALPQQGISIRFETGETPAPGHYCNGFKGDWWVVSRDIAADNIEDFCNQFENPKRYNVGSENELELVTADLNDVWKNPKDSPDCVGRFTRAVLDDCDGGDEANDPDNHKYGSILIEDDGWFYRMDPWAKQVDDDAAT